jgi:hypothetical protein
MAKFYSEKEWLSNSQDSRNPWSSSSTYIDVGSLRKVIYLAEQTGEIKAQGEARQDGEKSISKSQSLRLIEQIEILGNLESQLYKVKFTNDCKFVIAWLCE